MKYYLLNAALLLTVILPSLAQFDIVKKQLNTEPNLTFNCAQLNATNIAARYEIIQSKETRQIAPTHEIQLIKNQQQVLYKRSPATFEVWDRNGEYIRYFPKERRSITYRPSDLLSVNRRYDLEQQFHLVSPKLKSRLQQGKNTQRSCFEVSQYNGKQAGQTIILEWINTLSMPYMLTLEEETRSTTYRLIQANSITNEQVNALTQGYKDLDFADVGDSESDPFIAKMITQGFIQHGNSGFYDSNGNPISKEDGKHAH